MAALCASRSQLPFSQRHLLTIRLLYLCLEDAHAQDDDDTIGSLCPCISITNIATGETSEGNTPFHFFNDFDSFGFYRKITFITREVHKIFENKSRIYFHRIIQFSEKIDENILGSNFFYPKLSKYFHNLDQQKF